MNKIREVSLRLYEGMQKLIIPNLKYSQSIYEEVLREISTKAESWLDLGCGHQLLPSWRLDYEKEITKKAQLLIGLDYNHDSLLKHKSMQHKIRGDISCLPFRSCTFDLITANMVFEHLEKPNVQLKEIYRALKKGGILLFHTPNSLNYGVIIVRLVPEYIKKIVISFFHQRKEEDIFPTFYRINTPNKITRLSCDAGFEVISLRLIVSHAQFRIIPPLALLELLFVRLLMTKFGKLFRGNIITILKKR